MMKNKTVEIIFTKKAFRSSKCGICKKEKNYVKLLMSKLSGWRVSFILLCKGIKKKKKKKGSYFT